MKMLTEQERSMTHIAYGSGGASAGKVTLDAILAPANMALDVLREWRRRHRSRLELASYSYHERNDLGFSADWDAEIQKPFWSK
jgi:uncharacterized protein YjiS (DUF1127 family)